MDEETLNGFRRREDFEQFIEMRSDIKAIKELLTAHDLPSMRATLSFMERFFWIVATGTLTSLIIGLFTLLIK